MFELNIFTVLRTVAMRIVGAFSALIVTVVVANQLSVSDAGIFFTALSIIMFMTSIAGMGLDSAMLKLVSVYHAKSKVFTISALLKRYALIVFAFSCLLLLLTNLIYEFAIPIDSNNIIYFVRLLSPSVVFLTLNSFLALSLLATSQPLKCIFVQSVALNILFSLIVFCFQIELLSDVTTAYVITSLITLLFTIYYQRSYLFNRASVSIPSSQVKALARPLWIVAIANQGMMWSGQIISSFWLESEALAILSVSIRMSMTMNLVLVAINLIAAPAFASYAHKNDLLKIQKIVSKLLRFSVLLVTPMVAVFMIYPHYALALFGETYAANTNYFRLLVIAQTFSVLAGSVGFLLAMSGQENALKNIELCCLLLQISLCIVLIPWLGILGSVLAISITIIIRNTICCIVVYRNQKINMFKIFG